MADYVYLKNISGTLIKPVTDLAAINMTYTNGVEVNKVNGGTIGIVDGYIESSYYENMIDTEVGPARPESSYISGGTMYTLLGGYTISQDVPGQNPSPYKVPSEQAVRAAIDAYVATGGTDIIPGKAINVSGGSINVTTAEVEDVLDEATPVDTKAVTPEALLGALSVGQAVDVSCAPYTNTGTITYGAGGFLAGFTVTMVSGTTVGFYDKGDHSFPKFAMDGNDNPLHYIFIADVSGTGTITPNGYDAITLSNTPQRISTEVTAEDTGWFSAAAAATVNVANWRQYEVTALTAEAKEYIASAETNPDPDALFRSTNAYSILNKYLIKQDMVSPFVPIINMDNKNVTIGAGLAYSVKLTDGQNHEFTVDTIPSNGYGWDSHLQLFIAGTAGATFVPPLALMDPLTPNAGHNITIKWRAGQALAYVDDTDIGYVVSIQSGTENGTLYYGLKNETGEYVVFAGSLDGQVIEVTGNDAFVSRNARLIGNGAEDTIITGVFGAASSKTLELQSLSVAGGTIGGAGTTILDCMISDDLVLSSGTTKLNNVVVTNGSTVFWQGGTLTPVTITGNGVLDCGNKRLDCSSSTSVITMDGITITKAESPAAYWDGSVALLNTTEAHITGCTFTGITGNWLICAHDGNKYFNNCIFTGNTYNTASGSGDVVFRNGRHQNSGIEDGSLYMTNCIFSDNPSGGDIYLYYGARGYFKDCTVLSTNVGYSIGHRSQCTIDGGTVNGYFYTESGGEFIFRGNCIINKGASYYSWIYNNRYLTVRFVNGCTANFTGVSTSANDIVFKVGNPDPSIRNMVCKDTENGLVPGGTVTLVSYDGTVGTLSGCEFRTLYKDLTIDRDGAPITVGDMNLWVASNITFASPLDAAEADTIKLTGTTFTATARTLNASRIQLPASATVSLSGNTNADNTKILDAGLIVVGADPASPSGSATVVNASGVSSTVTGLGTYIDKEGDNDFVALNKVVAVNTDSAFATALTATTGADGTNRFIKLATGSTVTANYNEAKQITNKNIITNDYEPIIGGTFAISASTISGVVYPPSVSINQETKTLKVESGTFNATNIRGAKDNIIDLNGKSRLTYSNNGNTVNISGFTITGGNNPDVYTGGVLEVADGTLNVSNCTFSNNYAQYGSVMHAGSSLTIRYDDCIFIDNTARTSTTGVLYIQGSTCTLSNCEIGNTDTLTAFTPTESDYFTGYLFENYNKLKSYIYTTRSTIILKSNSTLDLTGNTNTTPLNYQNNGASSIIIEDNVKIIDKDGKEVTISGGTFQQIKNDNTFIVPHHTSTQQNRWEGNCIISGGTITSDGGGGIFVRGGTISATDCTFPVSLTLSSDADGTSWTNLTLSGTCITKGYFMNPSGSTAIDPVLKLEANTVLDVTNALTPPIGRNNPVGTVIVGTGVKFKNGTSTVNITGGTYHNCAIAKDGTITEA